jgi:hypothetical protein
MFLTQVGDKETRDKEHDSPLLLVSSSPCLSVTRIRGNPLAIWLESARAIEYNTRHGTGAYSVGR